VNFFIHPHKQPIVWLAAAAIVFAVVFFRGDATAGLQWMEGYLYEWIFQIDDLFVFHLIFVQSRIPKRLISKALFVSMCFQMVTRFLFYVGLAHLILQATIFPYLVGAILMYTGFMSLLTNGHKNTGQLQDGDKEVVGKEKEESEPVLPLHTWGQWLPFPVVDTWGDRGHDGAFFINAPTLKATPLLFVVVGMVLTDAVFGTDCAIAKIEEIPSMFRNFTSSVMAMIGIRSCYGLVSFMADRFDYIQYGIGCILIFMATELLSRDWLQIGALVSLIAMASILLIAVSASIICPRRSSNPTPAAEAQLSGS